MMMSFSYRNRVPDDAQHVFDVRGVRKGTPAYDEAYSRIESCAKDNPKDIVAVGDDGHGVAAELAEFVGLAQCRSIYHRD